MTERILPWLFQRRAICAVACLALASPVLAADQHAHATADDRTAAFPDVSGTPMHAHMLEDPVNALLRFDELEWQNRSGGNALHWDVTGWLGHDMNRLWLRDEGEKVSGTAAENRLEILGGHPIAAWWDLVAGARLDTSAGPARAYAAIGVQGVAPQWLHVEANAYLGEGGQAGLRLQADYDWLITNRAILSARVEGDAWTKDDERVGIGSGLSDVKAGLRLRYEVRREFAPYVGVEWQGLLGDTADLARDAGGSVRGTQLVAGFRFWF